MLKSLYTSATGMKAQQIMVDTIANNIANVNTAGYKKSQASFEDLLYVTLRSPGLQEDASGTASPIGLQVGSGVRLAGTTKVYSAGTLEGTGRQLDIALTGNGFLQVQMPDGQTGYTRDGQLLMNADGKLVTSSGLILQPEISFPNDIDQINIDQEGRVTGRIAGSSSTSTFGQIQLAKFVNPSGLSSQGGNVLRETDASGPATVANPGSNGLGLLQQGFIERSNVEIVNELVNLIVAQRANEVNSRSIQASDQMLSTATSLVR